MIPARVELVDIKALLGHESITTTQSRIYTNVGQERMAQVVARL